MNDKFVQVPGPFSTTDDIVTIIRTKYNNSFRYIKKLGIQSKITHMCIINGIEFEIGKTEILELNDVQVTSLKFKQEEPDSTLIDCILE